MPSYVDINGHTYHVLDDSIRVTAQQIACRMTGSAGFAAVTTCQAGAGQVVMANGTSHAVLVPGLASDPKTYEVHFKLP